MSISTELEKNVDALSKHLPKATVASEALLQGRKIVFIQHEGERYRLQLTRNNKLILTK
jgi:hemin uptake protein HemP